jgi:hypothetical protein
MEFANIDTSTFNVKAPPKPYPETKPDRDGNYSNDDKDFSQGSGFSPEEVQDIHSRSDVDASDKSQHHTLGTGRFQSSPGNHVHDGYRSSKIGQNMGITISGSRGGNAALASVIDALKLVMDITDNTTP